MWNCSLHLDKYQYVKTNPYIVRLIGLLGIVATLIMGYGFLNFIQLTPIYVIIFGPIVFIIITNKFIRLLIQLFYQKFDIKKHEEFVKNFWSKNSEPSVDIFLPWAGEELAVHEEVLKAVSKIDYKNYKVYMLDDAGSKEHKALAEKYGFIHLSRPNKGEFKKSGNLLYGYNHSDGEFVFILDADFIPSDCSLRDLIPYIVSDEEIGILQTPQYFEQTIDVHKRSKIEFGGGNIVEDFYRVIMPCRDEFKAAMCVGTSAIYRKSAIQSLQGTPKVHASEDLATGLLITQHGFYVKYIPLIESIGKSPETYQGYFKQHLRWCSGSLVFAKYWPHAHLSLMARLIYLVNPMYYFSEALTLIFSFQFLVLLYFHSDSLSLYQTLYFLPYIILSKIIIPFSKINKSKLGTKIAALNNSYTYFFTYISIITKNIPSWHPTGLKFSGLHHDFLSAINIGMAVSSLYIILFIGVIISKPTILGNYNTYAVLGWSFYSVFWHTLYLWMVSKYIHPFRLAKVTTSKNKALVYARTHLIVVLFLILVGSSIYNLVFALMDPYAPTAIAISQLKDKPKYITDLLAQENNLANQQNVLGATSNNFKATEEVTEISYTVQSGDALVKLAKRAVLEYSEKNEISLTQNQVNYASKFVSDKKNIQIKPGDEITFEQDLIHESLNASE